jgi:hypothetical protein
MNESETNTSRLSDDSGDVVSGAFLLSCMSPPGNRAEWAASSLLSLSPRPPDTDGQGDDQDGGKKKGKKASSKRTPVRGTRRSKRTPVALDRKHTASSSSSSSRKKQQKRSAASKTKSKPFSSRKRSLHASGSSSVDKNASQSPAKKKQRRTSGTRRELNMSTPVAEAAAGRRRRAPLSAPRPVSGAKRRHLLKNSSIMMRSHCLAVTPESRDLSLYALLRQWFDDSPDVCMRDSWAFSPGRASLHLLSSPAASPGGTLSAPIMSSTPPRRRRAAIAAAKQRDERIVPAPQLNVAFDSAMCAQFEQAVAKQDQSIDQLLQLNQQRWQP